MTTIPADRALTNFVDPAGIPFATLRRPWGTRCTCPASITSRVSALSATATHHRLPIRHEQISAAKWSNA